MEDFRGKVAVVTGAANGIGRALAEVFAREGMRVVLADVDADRLHSLHRLFGESGHDSIAVVCDVAVAEQVELLRQSTMNEFGAAHILCNNAGVVGRGMAWTGAMDDWNTVLGVNLFGVIHGVRQFLPLMIEQGAGHIINTASMAGLMPLPGAAPYSVSKHGVVALSESLYLELIAQGSPVCVSCLCPGFVHTDLMRARDDTADDVLLSRDAAAAAMFSMLQAGVHTGVEPSAIAEQVLQAIRDNTFWILTHDEVRGDPVARMRRAARGQNPTLWSESRHPWLAPLARRLRPAAAAVSSRHRGRLGDDH